MNAEPSVAVVVPVFNQADRTIGFLEHFRRVTYRNYRLIIVDDGSTDGTADWVARRFPAVVVLRGDGNLWWAGATNLGVRYALGHDFDLVLTLNHDVRVKPAFLTYLVETAQASVRAIIGCRIHFAADLTRTWAIGCTMDWVRGNLFHLADHDKRENEVLLRGPGPWQVQSLTGCGTLVPTACYREVGLYDAASYPQYHADTEFVLRARCFGYRPLVDPRAVIWNDAANTVADSVSRFVDFLFSPRSPVYWRALLAIHRRYCPPGLILPSLVQHYARFFWYNAPVFRAFKQFLRRDFVLGKMALSLSEGRPHRVPSTAKLLGETDETRVARINRRRTCNETKWPARDPVSI